MIYLDNNATTKLSPLVAARMHELMLAQLANPSSQHAEGRTARQIVEHARESILKCCGARLHGMASDSLLFTSGGTESNNLAILGMTKSRPGSIVVSAIEHPSVLAAADYAAMQGRTVRVLPCDHRGVVSLELLETWLASHATEPISLVSLMLANNETGVLQNVSEAAAMCRNAGVPIHTDAVQVLGKCQLDFAKLNVDAMTITAHKVHGPVGVGALILKHGASISPRAFGGFQQLGLRPGTESPCLAAGFEVAVSYAVVELDKRAETMRSLRDQLQASIVAQCPEAVVVGAEAARLPHTLSIAFPGVDRQALQLALDMAGVACSTGSACASGSSQPSHVLQAMQLDPLTVRGGVRFSLSADTSAQEIKDSVETLVAIVRRMLDEHKKRTDR